MCLIMPIHRASNKVTSSNAPDTTVQAALSNRVWEALFNSSPWGGMIFPTEPQLAGRGGSSASQQLLSSQGPPLGSGSPSSEGKQLPTALSAPPAHRTAADGPSAVAMQACTSAPEHAPQGLDALPLSACDNNAIQRPCSSSAPLEGRPQPPQWDDGPGGPPLAEDHWRVLYQGQAQMVHAMRCPRCGERRIVPILYGFPSTPLLSARQAKRLILGGDHLIEDCHVWACTACNSSYRCAGGGVRQVSTSERLADGLCTTCDSR